GIIGLGTSSTSNYYDVVADNVIAPVDALHVVNTLNSQSHAQSLGTGGAEGESAGLAAGSPPTSIAAAATTGFDDESLDFDAEASSAAKATTAVAPASSLLLSNQTAVMSHPSGST